jgi:hypothetical protein
MVYGFKFINIYIHCHLFQLYENVAFSVFGHTYFLEDGAEKATIFRGNLGAETRKISNDFDTDRGYDSHYT